MKKPSFQGLEVGTTEKVNGGLLDPKADEIILVIAAAKGDKQRRIMMLRLKVRTMTRAASLLLALLGASWGGRHMGLF